MRKRRDRTIPVVAERIAQRSSSAPKVTNLKVNNCAFGMPHYLPEINQSEDPESIKNHQDYMVTELKKRNTNSKKLDASMVATFSSRRHLIIDDNSLVSEVCRQYPALCDCQQVATQILFF